MTAESAVYLPAAERDLDVILDYLELEAGQVVASSYTARFKVAIERLMEFPSAGVARPELGSGVRHWVVDPYLILSDFDGTALHILRIVHGRRNVTQVLIKS